MPLHKVELLRAWRWHVAARVVVLESQRGRVDHLEALLIEPPRFDKGAVVLCRRQQAVLIAAGEVLASTRDATLEASEFVFCLHT